MILGRHPLPPPLPLRHQPPAPVDALVLLRTRVERVLPLEASQIYPAEPRHLVRVAPLETSRRPSWNSLPRGDEVLVPLPPLQWVPVMGAHQPTMTEAMEEERVAEM